MREFLDDDDDDDDDYALVVTCAFAMVMGADRSSLEDDQVG